MADVLNKTIKFMDLTITTGTTLYGNFYYNEVASPVSKDRIQALSIVTVQNNVPAFCMYTESIIRVFSSMEAKAVTVRILYV